MIICKPFSIVTVPFPFTDTLQNKRRPAVVLSNEIYQNHTGHVTLLMVTSAKHSIWYGDHKIIDLVSTGLTSESIVRQKIFTIDNRLVIACIGELTLKDKETVIRTIKAHLYIPFMNEF